MDGRDGKHVTKNMRSRAKSEKGIAVGVFTFRRAHFRKILLDMGVSQVTVDNVLVEGTDQKIWGPAAEILKRRITLAAGELGSSNLDFARD